MIGDGFSTIVEDMVVALRRCLVLVVAVGWVGLSGGSGIALAQDEAPPVPAVAQEAATKRGDVDRPLPDIPALMQEVLRNQRKEEAVRKDYLYPRCRRAGETDGHGGVKKTETKEYDIFWVGGVPVHRLMKKDGKELSADEQKKENERIDKEVAKAKEKREKADSQGEGDRSARRTRRLPVTLAGAGKLLRIQDE